MSAEPTLEQSSCFHCGLPADARYHCELEGQRREFCCHACLAVSTAIVSGGLGDFYRFRDQQSERAEDESERFEAYDDANLQQTFVCAIDEQHARVALQIGGISCAACAWLIEKHLEQLPGVDQVRVNVSTHRCSLRWHKNEQKLSAIFTALKNIGYKAAPANDDAAVAQRKKERRNALLRIGVAGLGMMQVGMVGFALHAGDAQGIDEHFRHFLRWVSLIFAIPVLLYSAQPFFLGAWRSLRLKHLNMDVPVSLALGLAFLASVFATLNNAGEVYFDSVSMFTFFLLIGRYLEMQARHRSARETEKLSQLLPLSVERRAKNGDLELLPLTAVKVGDRLHVRAGEVLPCDGKLLSDLAMLDEALLTGESDLQTKNSGASLLAGSVLGEPSIDIQVTACAEQTRLASVQALLEQALSQKPKQQQLADKVAGYFVAAVLLVCLSVYLGWLFVDADRAFWVALAVLVVTCPCALSLATPAALAAGLNKLRSLGLLLMTPGALETLPQIKHVVLDKTGTLTLGQPSISELRLLDAQQYSAQQLLDIVAAMEKHSRHPLAQAFKHIVSRCDARAVKAFPGQGLEAEIDNKRFRFGRADFACSAAPTEPDQRQWQLLSCEGRALAWFAFEDPVRPGLGEFVAYVEKQGLKLSVLSGDRQRHVDAFIDKYLSAHRFECQLGDLKPEQKLAQLQQLRRKGEPVLMLGDGINDVPVLGAADLSVAMPSASQLAKVNADSVLLNPQLTTLLEAMQFSARVKRVIRQNLSWALGYNALALPAAALGYIPPWLAAIGMSLSSLVVVLNSLRLSR
ncbi:heavy metal translocating P-type ATPase [Agaribacterium haliotis]|uniref:heavy metal translocating P-type ATPase n=1 Tax=Agaribacterium haliotis TaxID=2013869 RepID=UPI000BB5582E|nr:heavy metal translocating P-type ATPase [Agaribacterium haliotis]